MTEVINLQLTKKIAQVAYPIIDRQPAPGCESFKLTLRCDRAVCSHHFSVKEIGLQIFSFIFWVIDLLI
jgi:hypothetical protein